MLSVFLTLPPPVSGRLGDRVVRRRAAQRAPGPHNPADENLKRQSQGTIPVSSLSHSFLSLFCVFVQIPSSGTFPSWMRMRIRMMRSTRPRTVSKNRKAPWEENFSFFVFLSFLRPRTGTQVGKMQKVQNFVWISKFHQNFVENTSRSK